MKNTLSNFKMNRSIISKNKVKQMKDLWPHYPELASPCCLLLTAPDQELPEAMLPVPAYTIWVFVFLLVGTRKYSHQN